MKNKIIALIIIAIVAFICRSIYKHNQEERDIKKVKDIFYKMRNKPIRFNDKSLEFSYMNIFEIDTLTANGVNLYKFNSDTISFLLFTGSSKENIDYFINELTNTNYDYAIKQDSIILNINKYKFEGTKLFYENNDKYFTFDILFHDEGNTNLTGMILTDETNEYYNNSKDYQKFMSILDTSLVIKHSKNKKIR